MQRSAPAVHEAGIDAAALLEAMVRIDSFSGDEALLGAFLHDELAAAGFATRIDAAGNLVAEWGDGETIALVGHMDTAPGRVAVRRERNVLYGRGAVDAKGPLAAACSAVSRMPRDGGRRYVVVGAVEEEATSRGAHHLVTSMQPPAELVILEPSGWEGITIGYKGSVRLRWMRRQPAGHGAGPLPSAADHAFEFVRRVQDHAAGLSGDIGIFDRLDVRVLRCDAGSDGLQEHAAVDVGLRMPPGCDTRALRAALDDLSRDGELHILYADEGVRTDRSSPLARRFVRAVRDAGGAPRFKLKTGTSDLNILVPAWRCPAVAYGPGNSRLDHTPGEHIDLGELDSAVAVLESVLREP